APRAASYTKRWDTTVYDDLACPVRCQTGRESSGQVDPSGLQKPQLRRSLDERLSDLPLLPDSFVGAMFA
ncbi:hypothetical protein, partial [Paracoccus rhizosphaerae]